MQTQEAANGWRRPAGAIAGRDKPSTVQVRSMLKQGTGKSGNAQLTAIGQLHLPPKLVATLVCARRSSSAKPHFPRFGYECYEHPPTFWRRQRVQPPEPHACTAHLSVMATRVHNRLATLKEIHVHNNACSTIDNFSSRWHHAGRGGRRQINQIEPILFAPRRL
jgi:hypothetical protein